MAHMLVLSSRKPTPQGPHAGHGVTVPFASRSVWPSSSTMILASVKMFCRGGLAPSWRLAAARRALDWQPRRGHRLTPADDELYQKTMLKVLEQDSSSMTFIHSYSSRGFTINGNKVVGPCAIIPHAILQWNVGSYQDITEESLVLFRLLEPRIEILVLGVGNKVERLEPAVLKFMRECGIAVEVQDTPNACATFNFLTSERRATAAALIPPSAGRALM
ncbi:NADH dehydrogenase [ubiquinone] 1 alpha subcomplex assembly factor 3-like isoform X1 [Mauremys reevesii]|uniref:NADH dehydrogenase [ubiquinone] 1 alpha subcomplex assembly factor 3-like isoform X1 n=2 Tax=Mauremys reevesii TaxID=260615 RepID=UPI00193ECBAA|nr:NADH dehydrogenase [ubiquinone] 1 alpha subcomplex assembly factor 3-like isoform X1 [Mauremys reevesii]